ncbi:metabolite traffic protein EboE [Microbulbifer rhizosphaerae]|uniref:Xylose isomerase-like TIM barrel n=1 Tax=Microbulbifer rhizosphaerae TaxID=1562603 RepID=A0A7W4WFI6_9GAMM|nr:metabolite traffic protein EboE [Microbulbifer rhizosphaerae]MBB3063279.1 hypothetical protein [Microbulbifer rhizosphaerae]
MRVNGYELTYCSNIHPGETWLAVFANLQRYLPAIKQEVSPAAPFGIGLRLSNQASIELAETEGALAELQRWLQARDCYVFTLNGFPYGEFHDQAVKDRVHVPDWGSAERLDYTRRLFALLAALLPDGAEGGISTSPLSYKYWHNESQANELKQQASLQLAEVAAYLHELGRESGKDLHLDIEPEPDGLLENTYDVIDYYRNWLIPVGGRHLQSQYQMTPETAERCLRDRIRLCYDICHFAVVHEAPRETLSCLEEAGIRIGKVQISAALKARLENDVEQNQRMKTLLQPFAESVYLHQVVARDTAGAKTAWPDLADALESLQSGGPAREEEWRTHFHVPVFLAEYGSLASTQQDIIDTLDYLREKRLCRHLEVETYTWNVLPQDLQMNVKDAIVRELNWVRQRLPKHEKNLKSDQ